MLSSHIEDIITAIKAMPNSLWRNKAMSHAHDALAAIVMLETTMYASGSSNGHTEPLSASETADTIKQPINGLTTTCICVPGIRDMNCPLHGQRNIS
jgi:hypothetical protein